MRRRHSCTHCANVDHFSEVDGDAPTRLASSRHAPFPFIEDALLGLADIKPGTLRGRDLAAIRTSLRMRSRPAAWLNGSLNAT